MALDAVVFPQDPFGYSCSSFRDYFQGEEDEMCGGGSSISGIMDTHSCSYDQLFHEPEGDKSLVLTLLDKDSLNFVNWLESSSGNTSVNGQWVPNCNNTSSEDVQGVSEMPLEEEHQKDQQVTTRRKRRRTKTIKNKEEVENQRMTHIAVERNRRKQMNEYLAVLRSLMPSSYAQRGDQASIIGGAINFVKELEQLLQTLEAKKNTKYHHQQQLEQNKPQENFVSPFYNFIKFPQYTTKVKSTTDDKLVEDQYKAASAADIEVSIVESHANVKILAKRCSKQLVKLVSTFQSLRLIVQHLNVSSLEHMVLYSISVKVEEGSKLNSVEDIAAAVNEMLHKIEEESN